MTFEEAKTNLINSRKAWYAGTGTKESMLNAAREAAQIYNQKAKEVAARCGMKARLTTPEKIMRSIDLAR